MKKRKKKIVFWDKLLNVDVDFEVQREELNPLKNVFAPPTPLIYKEERPLWLGPITKTDKISEKGSVEEHNEILTFLDKTDRGKKEDVDETVSLTDISALIEKIDYFSIYLKTYIEACNNNIFQALFKGEDEMVDFYLEKKVLLQRFNLDILKINSNLTKFYDYKMSTNYINIPSISKSNLNFLSLLLEEISKIIDFNESFLVKIVKIVDYLITFYRMSYISDDSYYLWFEEELTKALENTLMSAKKLISPNLLETGQVFSLKEYKSELRLNTMKLKATCDKLNNGEE